MPGPAVYVIAIVGAVAAGFAFKEFVYEPHIAPKIEQWAEEFIAKRQARRRQRAGPVPVEAVPTRGGGDLSARRRDKRSDSGDEGPEMRQSIELENLIAKEVQEWRAEVNRSQSVTRGLRHRNNAGPSGSQHTLDEPTDRIPFVPMSPTHIIFDPSSPSTPTSTVPSGGASPSICISSLKDTPSQLTLRSPLPAVETSGKLPTPGPSHASLPSLGATYVPPFSPASIPSLSQTYPQDLDQEHGLELLSAPSSRPETPFSTLSHPASAQSTGQSNYHSFSSHIITSPLARPPSRSLSDLEFLSDVETMSPVTSTSESIETFDYEVRSEASSSSWASAGARSH